jgi:hypothetical protein
MEKTKIELSTLNGGMALDMFNEELKKVLANIEDENTNATQHRKVVLTVDFKPDSERKLGVATISVRSSLAPIIPQGKSVYFGYDESGEFSAFEDNPKQLDNDYRQAMGVDEWAV